MKEKITAIENKIRKEVPRLTELSFGCEIKGKLETESCVILGKHGNFWFVSDEKNGIFHTATYGENAGFKILGHPIQLSDLLYVMYKDEPNADENKWTYIAGVTSPTLYFASHGSEKTAQYNLSLSFKENLEQSPELVKFLFSLICK